MFKKKLEFLVPIKGVVKPITETPDEVFSTKMLGDGICITPEEGLVVAPFDGTIETLFPTGHAVGLKSTSGVELLIHIGIDTVELGGKGFEMLVEVGQVVTQGQPLVNFDLAYIKEHAPSIVTPVIFMQKEEVHLKEIQSNPLTYKVTF